MIITFLLIVEIHQTEIFEQREYSALQHVIHQQLCSDTGKGKIGLGAGKSIFVRLVYPENAGDPVVITLPGLTETQPISDITAFVLYPIRSSTAMKLFKILPWNDIPDVIEHHGKFLGRGKRFESFQAWCYFQPVLVGNDEKF